MTTLIGRKIAPTISGSHNDFVVYLKYDDFVNSGAGTPLDILNQIDDGGGNLRFSSDEAGLSLLPCEVVTFDKAANNIFVKVLIPTAATGQIFYIRAETTGATQPLVTDLIGRNSVYPNHTFGSNCENATPIDFSGNLTSGIIATDTTVVAGNIGKALDFNGSTSNVNLGTLVQPSNDFTLRAFINPDALASFQGVIGNWVSNENNRSYLGTSNNQANFDSYTGGTGAGGSLTNGSWALITASRNGTSTKLYVDGVSVLTQNDPVLTPAPSNTYLGALQSGTNYFFNGQMSLVEATTEGVSDDYELTVYQNYTTVGSWGVTEYIESGGDNSLEVTEDLVLSLFDSTISVVESEIKSDLQLTLLDSSAQESTSSILDSSSTILTDLSIIEPGSNLIENSISSIIDQSLLLSDSSIDENSNLSIVGMSELLTSSELAEDNSVRLLDLSGVIFDSDGNSLVLVENSSTSLIDSTVIIFESSINENNEVRLLDLSEVSFGGDTPPIDSDIIITATLRNVEISASLTNVEIKAYL